MKNLRVLTFQDISCVGQCSLTAALPIISACGFETVILPSAVLSTHTGGSFSGSGYTFRDLTEDIPGIIAHWQQQGIRFDCLYTGYLGSARQIEYVYQLKKEMFNGSGLLIVDPVMGDGGHLYDGFEDTFVKEMAGLCGIADVILPNITEACLMTGMPMKLQMQDKTYVRTLIEKLAALGAKKIILKGISYVPGQIGVAVYDSSTKTLEHYFTPKIDQICHGTGDCYASAFTGALLQGQDPLGAAKIAGDFVFDSIKKTMDDKDHWYGVRFEKALPGLIRRLGL